jgi:hypothetical protein
MDGDGIVNAEDRDVDGDGVPNGEDTDGTAARIDGVWFKCVCRSDETAARSYQRLVQVAHRSIAKSMANVTMTIYGARMVRAT